MLAEELLNGSCRACSILGSRRSAGGLRAQVAGSELLMKRPSPFSPRNTIRLRSTDPCHSTLASLCARIHRVLYYLLIQMVHVISIVIKTLVESQPNYCITFMNLFQNKQGRGISRRLSIINKLVGCGPPLRVARSEAMDTHDASKSPLTPHCSE